MTEASDFDITQLEDASPRENVLRCVAAIAGLSHPTGSSGAYATALREAVEAHSAVALLDASASLLSIAYVYIAGKTGRPLDDAMRALEQATLVFQPEPELLEEP